MNGDEAQPNRLRGGVSRPNRLGQAAPTRGGDMRPTAGPGRTRSGLPPFGPNTDGVVLLLRAVGALSPFDAQRLHSYWKAGRGEALDLAHVEAQSAAAASGRREAARAAQDEALHVLEAAADLGLDWGQPGSTRGSIRDAAQLLREAFPAVLDAVAGVVLADVLDSQTLDVLVGPWRRAFGGLPGEEGPAASDGANA